MLLLVMVLCGADGVMNGHEKLVGLLTLHSVMHHDGLQVAQGLRQLLLVPVLLMVRLYKQHNHMHRTHPVLVVQLKHPILQHIPHVLTEHPCHIHYQPQPFLPHTPHYAGFAHFLQHALHTQQPHW